MAVTVIPQVTNWTVAPQNGQAGYFTLMNTWLGQSTTVIASLQTAITAQNTANAEINALAIQTETARNEAVVARNEAVDAIALLSSGSIDDTTIASNKAYSNQKTNELLDNKIDKDISTYTDKPTPVDADLIPLSDSASSFGIKKLSWANLKATLKTYFDTLYTVSSSETTSGIIELATTAEAQAGTDDLRAITPLKLFNSLKGSNQSLSASGYQKLHGGLIIQWGLATAGVDASITVTLPISFPNLFLNVIGGNKASAVVGNGVSSVHCNPLNKSSFALVNDSFTTSVGNECYWFAIGY